MLTVIDEYTRECLAIALGRRVGFRNLIGISGELRVRRVTLKHTRSDRGPGFCAKAVRECLYLYVCRRVPHRTRQSIGERLVREVQWLASRGTVQQGEIFYTFQEAKSLTEYRCCDCNQIRPSSSLGCRSAAPRARTLIRVLELTEGGRLDHLQKQTGLGRSSQCTCEIDGESNSTSSST